MALELTVTEATQPNFGNVKYVAVIDGEIVGNGETRESAYSDGLRTLLNGYRTYHYPASDLIVVNGVAHHKALLNR